MEYKNYAERIKHCLTLRLIRNENLTLKKLCAFLLKKEK